MMMKRLRFGVELSTLYPAWYLHPALKNLIYEALVNTKRRNVATLHEVLDHASEYQGCLEERLYFKDRLIVGKNIIGLKTSPGVHLWVLRHFLGLLPTPLFPREENRPNFWLNISTQCKDNLILVARKTAISNHLGEMIASELSRLPSRNLTLIFELFELFRDLGAKTFQKSMVDKQAVKAVVRFFTPCMFMRPYRPGVTTNNDKRLFPLVLFTIIYWKNIKSNCQDFLTNAAKEETLYKFFYLPEIPEGSQEDDFEKDTSRDKDTYSCSSFEFIESTKKDDTKYLADNFTQTSDQESSEKENKNVKYATSTPLISTAVSNEAKCSDELKNKYQSEDLFFLRKPKLPKYKENSYSSIPASNIDNTAFDKKARIEALDKSKNIDQNNLAPHHSKHDLLDFSEDYMEKKPEGNKNTILNKLTKEKQNKIEIKKQDVPKSSERNPCVKVTRIKKRFRRHPQIVVLQINPCNCADRKTRVKSKKPKRNLQTSLGNSAEEKSEYETDEKHEENSKQVLNNELTLLDTPNFCCNYAKKINYEFGNPSKSCGWNLAGCSKECEDGYIYDSFVGPQQEEKDKTVDVLNTSNLFDTVDTTAKNNDIMEKITKIGWTYENKSGMSTPKIRNELNDIYHLYFDTESKKLEKMERKQSATDNILHATKKDSSILSNLKKVGSKLNIFKVFSAKQLLNKSVSYENLISDIRDKKTVRTSHSL